MTHSPLVRLARSSSWLASVYTLAACSSGAPPSPEPPSGNVAFALVAHTADHTYRLRHATFAITRPGGDPVASLDSDADPDAEQLKQRLDPGGYHVQLSDAWLLAREEAVGPDTLVDAFLESPMSGGADFEITDGVTTTVPYQFVTDGVPVGFGTGEVAISIGVREEATTARLDLSSNVTSVETELGTTNEIELSLAAAGGFSGPVALTGSLLDDAGNAMTGWTLTVAPATLEVANGTLTKATATLTIPSQNRGLAAVARFTATSAASQGTRTVDVPVSALNQYTIDLAVDANGQCAYPAAGTLTLTQGTKLRWLNVGMSGWSIHTTGSWNCPHQSTNGLTPAGGTYECPSLLGSTSGSWYCHAPGPNVGGLNVTVVAP